MTRFLTVEDVAARYGVSRRWVHERTRVGKPSKFGTLPHRVLPHTRRVLFEEQDLRAYEAGQLELERVDLVGGGRVLRPKARTS